MRTSLAAAPSDPGSIRELNEAISQILQRAHAAEVTLIVKQVAAMHQPRPTPPRHLR